MILPPFHGQGTDSGCGYEFCGFLGESLRFTGGDVGDAGRFDAPWADAGGLWDTLSDASARPSHYSQYEEQGAEP